MEIKFSNHPNEGTFEFSGLAKVSEVLQSHVGPKVILETLIKDTIKSAADHLWPEVEKMIDLKRVVAEIEKEIAKRIVDGMAASLSVKPKDEEW